MLRVNIFVMRDKTYLRDEVRFHDLLCDDAPISGPSVTFVFICSRVPVSCITLGVALAKTMSHQRSYLF